MVSKKKSFISLMTCVFIVLGLFLNSIPVFAENSVTGTTVDLTSTINVTNDVVAPPETTMNFGISAGSAVVGSVGHLPISAGIGSPTITSSVTFTSSDYVPGIGLVAKTASKDITVDFSGVTFTRVGIYRYVITQTTSSPISAMEYANNLYIDVYVTTDGTNLSAAYVVSNATTGNKTNDFENTYPVVPGNIKITNTITGNQRELDREFRYTLTVTSSNMITVTKTDLSSNVSTISETSAGVYEFVLKGDEYVILAGLTTGDTYEVIQDDEIENGYTTSYKIGLASPIQGLDTGVVTVDSNFDNVTFINNRDCGTPTGVVMNTTPYFAMLAVAGLFVFFMISKRKKEEEYEG